METVSKLESDLVMDSVNRERNNKWDLWKITQIHGL